MKRPIISVMKSPTWAELLVVANRQTHEEDLEEVAERINQRLEEKGIK